MSGAQEILDIVHHDWDILACLSRHEDNTHSSEKFRAQDFAFGGGKRQDDEIVLVLAGDRLPFGRENPDYPERDVSDADLTADHVLAGLVQILGSGFPQHDDLRG